MTKQVLFGFFLFLAMPALAQNMTETTCDPVIEQANLETFQNYLRDLTTLMGNFDRTLYWSNEATLNIPAALPYGGEYTFDKFPEYERALMETWQLSMGQPPMLYASCDKVFLQGFWDATAKATGEKVSTPILEVFTFQDGKIVNDTFFFFDLQDVVQALGL
jgi:ketosteroid isomerase-like protein